MPPLSVHCGPRSAFALFCGRISLSVINSCITDGLPTDGLPTNRPESFSGSRTPKHCRWIVEIARQSGSKREPNDCDLRDSHWSFTTASFARDRFWSINGKARRASVGHHVVEPASCGKVGGDRCGHATRRGQHIWRSRKWCGDSHEWVETEGGNCRAE